MGIKVQLVNGQEEMIRQLQNERGTVQESRPIINYNNSKKATKAERKEILNIVKSKKYNIPGTDAVIIKDNPNAIYLIDHSADEQLYDNLKKGGDGFGIRKVYKVSRLNDDSIREIIRNIAQGHNYTERSLHNKLLSLGITQEHLSGIDLNAELKMGSSDNAGILSAGKGQEREIGYNQSGTNGRESQKGAGLEEGKQSSSIDTFTTPDGTVYGYATKDGRMVLDRSAIKPEHPLHEYTHLWDNVVAQKNPELWKRGVELMKQLDNGKVWKQFAEDENYGKKWAKMNLTQEQFDNMVASEVHARLVGENGAKLLDSIAKQKGQKGIIAKLKAWILEAWQNLKATFSNWSEDDIKKLTLKDFNHMTVRDFADAVDFNAIKESESSNSNLDSFNNGENRSNNINIENNGTEEIQQSRGLVQSTVSGSIKINWQQEGSRGDNSWSQSGQSGNGDASRGIRRNDADVANQVSQASNALDKVLADKGIVATKQKVHQSSSQEFHDAIAKAKKDNPNGWMVDVLY